METLTNPDHLQKVKEILDNASTPFDYYRIDERVNESYRQPTAANANAATSWLAANCGARRDVPNVPIVRELRIDITTLHPSAIYRLEQFRRRQLKARTLPMRMDEFVEEKEPEWIKQRTREQKLARMLEREKERVRRLEEEAREKKRLAEEKEREHAATVRRHLRMSSGSRRARRHSDDATSDRSSEMSPVPSNVSSPSPPPPQIFHEVQESVPFPFQPSSPLSSLHSPETLRNQLSPLATRKSILPQTSNAAAPAQTAHASASAEQPLKPIPRLKIKFKGASLSVEKIKDNGTNDHIAVNDASRPAASTSASTTEGKATATMTDARHTNKGIPTPSANSPFDHQNRSQASPSTTGQSAKIVSPASESPVVGAVMETETVPTQNRIQPPPAEKTLSVSVEHQRAPPIPRAAQDVISQMEISLTDQDSIGRQRHGVADVDIAIDVTVEEGAVSSTSKAPAADHGQRLLTLQDDTSKVDTQNRERSQPSLDVVCSQQDEEDEAMVEELGGLDELSRDDSSGKGSARVNGDFALSSAGSLAKGKAPDRFFDIATDEGRVCDYISPGQPVDATAAPTTTFTGKRHDSTSPSAAPRDSDESHVEGPEPGTEMIIDDELEPVSVQDTQSGSWKQKQKGEETLSPYKGGEGASFNRRKGKAKELSIRIRSSESEDSEDTTRWAHSAKIIQIKGITGPTATDTESPSVDSPDPPSVSPPLMPSPKVQPSAIQEVSVPSDITAEPGSANSASSASLEQRRQKEALYAALAANFLSRCGSTSQAHALYDPTINLQPGRLPQSVWCSSSGSSSRTSGTPPEQYLLQQRGRMTTCDPRDVFGRTIPGDSSLKVKKEEADKAEEAESVGEPKSDPRESNEEKLTSDDDTTALQTDNVDTPPPLEQETKQVVDAEMANGDASLLIEIQDEGDSETQGEFPRVLNP